MDADTLNFNKKTVTALLDGEKAETRILLKEDAEDPPLSPGDEIRIRMAEESVWIWVRVEDVRSERLQDVTVEGARRSGADISQGFADFAKRWDSQVKTQGLGLYGWDANPLVWAVTFSVSHWVKMWF
jgi:hypothetical protein